MVRVAAVLAVLAGLAAAGPAAAQPAVRALAEQSPAVAGPGLVAGQVVYGQEAGADLRILGQPVAGGPVAELARVRSASFWELAVGDGALALLDRGERGRRRLLAGPPGGPLTLVRRRVRAGPAMAEQRALFAVAGGPLVLERTDRHGARLRAVLHPPGGPSRRLALPAGADARLFAAAGGVAAVALPRRGEIALLDLPSGAVRRRLPLGDFTGSLLTGVAVSAAGDVAITAEGEGASDFIGWAPAGAAAPRAVGVGDEFDDVRTAGGRIALSWPARRGDGSRVVVIDPSGPEPRVVFRGPPAAYVRTLAYDGANVAWATDFCQLVAVAAPSGSADRIPPGPCVRTDAWFTTYDDGLRRRSLRLGVRCLTAPGPRCRIDVRLYVRRRIARHVTTVPLGRRQFVRVPLSRRARERIRRDRLQFFVVARVVDPDGRSRVALELPL